MQDTGPGIDENNAAPFAQELHDATELANDTTEASPDRRRGIAHWRDREGRRLGWSRVCGRAIF